MQELAPVWVGLFAFALGLVQVTSQPRSYDERISIDTATRSLAGIWRAARSTEAPHLLYYLLIKPWLAVFGTSDLAARFPSVIAAALSALVLTALGTRLFTRSVGVISGLTLASAAYVMHFTQWARSYSLALLFTTIATYALVRVLETESRRWTAVWCLTLATACWLNLFTIAILAAHAVAYLLKRPRPNPRLAALAAASLAVTVTPIIVLIATADNGQLNWIPTPTLKRALTQSWDWSSRNPFALLAATIALIAIIRRTPPIEPWKGALILGWTVAPFLLTLTLSAIQPAFDSHYLLTAAAGLALLVGVGITTLPRPAALTLLALMTAAATLQLTHYYIAPGKPLNSLI